MQEGSVVDNRGGCQPWVPHVGRAYSCGQEMYVKGCHYGSQSHLMSVVQLGHQLVSVAALQQDELE